MPEKVSNLHQKTQKVAWQKMVPESKDWFVSLAKRITTGPSVAIVALISASILYTIAFQVFPYTSFWSGMILLIIITPIVAYPLGHVFALYQKILERKNNELRGNNEIKNRLIYILSHDIKSPLHNIQQTLRMISNGYINPTEFENLANGLYADVDNTLNLTNNLISWINVQQNDFLPESTTFNINHVLNETVDLYRPMAVRKGIVIEITADENLKIDSDQEMWKIILRNLISNAIKFTSTNGFVHLGVKSDGNKVLCWISDNGVGIKSVKLPTILNQSFVESEPGTENEKGTGLGLNLVKNIVTKLGGEITVESKENVGTTFYFSIPTEK